MPSLRLRLQVFSYFYSRQSSNYSMEYKKDIIVTDRLGMVSIDSEEEYLAHLLLFILLILKWHI